MAIRKGVYGIAADLLLWYGLAAAFLLLYVRGDSEPAAAIAPHLVVIAVPLCALALARLALSRLITNRILQRALCTALLAGTLVALLLYYTFVLVGLRFWGGVVTWDVIPTFFEEGPELADALGMSRALLGLVAVAAALGVLGFCWLYLKWFDWARDVRVSSAALGTVVVCGFAILGVAAYNFAHAPWVAEAEPVSLTLFPRLGARDLEGHAVNPQTARALDALEDGARAAYVPVHNSSAPNVILIVVDALRPDHMGVFGYSRDTTPNLSRLERGARVRKSIAHASCADTICGLLSLATSKFPRGLSFRGFGLSEVLHRNGYRVHMVLSGDHTHFYSMRSYYGGVDTFYDGTDAPGYFLNDDQLVIDHVAGMPDWDGVPTMFQFHLMSAHILRKRDDTGSFQPAERYLATPPQAVAAADRTSQSAVNFYDNGVARADAVIGQLLKELGAKGYLRGALVVITADHGESLGEHGLYGHANSVREEVLRVPLLMVSYDDRPPRPLDPRLQALQVDIAPTILADLAIPAPSTWAGRPLQDPSGRAFTYFEERLERGLIDTRDPAHLWKYWMDGQDEHAFNLSGDEHERRDLIGSVPDELRRQWRILAALGSPAGGFGDSSPPADNSRHLWTSKVALSSASDTQRASNSPRLTQN